jgi:hypothetical protein
LRGNDVVSQVKAGWIEISETSQGEKSETHQSLSLLIGFVLQSDVCISLAPQWARSRPDREG